MTTHTDYYVLVLLLQQNLSGYAIRNVVKTSAIGNFSSSPGTIYPCLRRLTANGMIEKKTEETSGTQRVFSITQKGIRTVHRWITEPPTIEVVGKNFNDILLRFAFMPDDIPRTSRAKFLREFQKYVDVCIDDLKKVRHQQQGALTTNARDVLDFRIESYKNMLKWIRRVS